MIVYNNEIHYNEYIQRTIIKYITSKIKKKNNSIANAGYFL